MTPDSGSSPPQVATGGTPLHLPSRHASLAHGSPSHSRGPRSPSPPSPNLYESALAGLPPAGIPAGFPPDYYPNTGIPRNTGRLAPSPPSPPRSPPGLTRSALPPPVILPHGGMAPYPMMSFGPPPLSGHSLLSTGISIQPPLSGQLLATLELERSILEKA